MVANIGATIMGRNMFGPVRGPWGDERLERVVGRRPAVPHPVFVLTHHAREPMQMQGGTTFHFVTDGIESALEHAFDAAGGHDISIGGGAETVQQYLRAQLVDEMGIHVSPLLLGSGSRLFDHLDGGPAGFELVSVVSSPAAAAFPYVRSGGA